MEVLQNEDDFESGNEGKIDSDLEDNSFSSNQDTDNDSASESENTGKSRRNSDDTDNLPSEDKLEIYLLSHPALLDKLIEKRGHEKSTKATEKEEV